MNANLKEAGLSQTLTDKVALALEAADAEGATAAQASASQDAGLSVNVRRGEVETLEHHKDQGIAITVFVGECKGSASTADLRDASIREAAAAACRIAKVSEPDPCAGLADAALMATDIPDLDLYHPWQIDADSAIALARDCESVALGMDKRIVNSEGAEVGSFTGQMAYGNSHGFIGGYATSRHSLSCSVVAGDAQGMQRDYWYTAARCADDLLAAEEIGRQAAERALKRLGGRRLSTRRCPVLFVPETARSLLGQFMGAISGGSLYRRASFLVDHLGQRVFPEFVRIHERPHLLRGLGSAPFDAEGVATADRDFVNQGVLESYVLSSYAARRLGMVTTGNAGGVRNLEMVPGDLDLPALLREMGTGLMLTELIGHGTNMVTGDYSRGAAGFWVENGEILYPVEEITVAGNLKQIFAELVAVGKDVDRRGGIHTGSWLVDGLTVAGD